MITRRGLVKDSRRRHGACRSHGPLAAGGGAQAADVDLDPALPEGVRANATLKSLPGKKPLIKLSYRPPNYETPLEHFRTAITPNDAFFVRYHLVEHPAGRRGDLAAAGRRRGRQQPGRADARRSQAHAGGRGRRRQPVLRQSARPVFSRTCRASSGATAPWVARAGRAPASRTCSTGSASRRRRSRSSSMAPTSGVTDKTPDFIKSIPAWKAIEDTTIIAYEMNGEPLPHFNGFPARLIVPGWTGTYWMKHIISISALTKPQSGFWMAGPIACRSAGFRWSRASCRRRPRSTRRSPKWWSIR